jgi:hypothetical protein
VIGEGVRAGLTDTYHHPDHRHDHDHEGANVAKFQTQYTEPTTGQIITVSADSPAELSEAVAQARGTDQASSDLETAYLSGGTKGLLAYLEQQGVPTTAVQD